MNLKKNILKHLFAGIIFVPICFCMAQEVKTNLECVIGATRQLAKESADSLRNYVKMPVFIKMNKGPDDLSVFILNQFVHGLQNVRDSVFVTFNIPVNGILLSVIPLKATVSYPELKSSGWFKDGTIDREVDVALSVNALDIESDKLIFQTTLESSKRDQFPHSQLDEVEKDMLLEKPPRPSQRGFRAYAEPVLALITLCGTVYLFYSIRSQ